ncbi:hypothetical protein ERX27_09900 [Macrococcus brunensis]|uniref:Uncharacterized protein n=1 Tax=Macrococcus brunensis TaxID=198483 RepID=A0A4R6BB36_9STAP|nr:hypothetical protein [Macrococcus brunensis]TDL94180.1 hypothetical protein ERX27_09900 [Macrococcus brunensis]
MSKQLWRTLITTLLIINVGAILLLTESYFNWQEINQLVRGADARGLDYELVITNEWTNDYQFHIK